jgi:hypothetical protein
MSSRTSVESATAFHGFNRPFGNMTRSSESSPRYGGKGTEAVWLFKLVLRAMKKAVWMFPEVLCKIPEAESRLSAS